MRLSILFLITNLVFSFSTYANEYVDGHCFIGQVNWMLVSSDLKKGDFFTIESISGNTYQDLVFVRTVDAVGEVIELYSPNFGYRNYAASRIKRIQTQNLDADAVLSFFDKHKEKSILPKQDLVDASFLRALQNEIPANPKNGRVTIRTKGRNFTGILEAADAQNATFTLRVGNERISVHINDFSAMDPQLELNSPKAAAQILAPVSSMQELHAHLNKSSPHIQVEATVPAVYIHSDGRRSEIYLSRKFHPNEELYSYTFRFMDGRVSEPHEVLIEQLVKAKRILVYK
ncbi:MAG: hypothetical protein AB7F43_13660 [Bacteriovoracia bacterium]